MPEHGQALPALVAKEPDLTLAKMKERLGSGCSVQTRPDVAQTRRRWQRARFGAGSQLHRKNVEQSKGLLRKAKTRTLHDLPAAISAALRAVTAPHALN